MSRPDAPAAAPTAGAPQHAGRPAGPPVSAPAPAVAGSAPNGPASGAQADGHERRLREGARRLRATARTFKVTDRTLLVVGGILAPLGLLVIIIGWWGASHSPYLFQQIPYLISGGLFGLGLVILGSFLYFGYWLTRIVQEQRRQGAAVVEALERLERTLAPLRVTPNGSIGHNGHSPGPAAQMEAVVAGSETGSGAAHAPAATDDREAASRLAASLAALPDQPADAPEEPRLLATARGTMAHRPDCVVVAAKSGLRVVTRADGLAACKLCDPYGN